MTTPKVAMWTGCAAIGLAGQTVCQPSILMGASRGAAVVGLTPPELLHHLGTARTTAARARHVAAANTRGA